MPADPICIITANGMQCMSSPVKSHFPGQTQCTETDRLPEQAADIAAIKSFLLSHAFERGRVTVASEKADLIARVTYLLTVANVLDHRLPFVISRSRGDGMNHVKPFEIPEAPGA